MAKPYNKKNDKPQDKEDTKNLTPKGKKAFEKADKKQPKSDKENMDKDRAWDRAAIKKIAKTCSTGGNANFAPKYIEKSAAKRNCPSTPILNKPALKVMAMAIAAM